MPRVPTVQGPGVQLNALPDAYQRAPQALGQAGQVTAGYINQGAQIAGAVNEVAQRARDEADAVRVDDAVNQLKERQIDLTFNKDTGFVNQRGLAAMQRPSGRPLADEYGDELQKAATNLANGLGTERQKRVFAMQANGIVTGFRSSVYAHEGKQNHEYGLSVREGKITNRQDQVGKFYNDPAQVDDGLLGIGAAVADMGRMLGKSAEWIEARGRVETSKALMGAVNGALEQNNILAADTLLKTYGERMTADDLVRARGVVDKQLDAGIALQAATAVVGRLAPTIQPTDMDRAVNITMQSESGGKRYGKDGSLLTSPKGAKGEMQVLDSTSKAPGFGVTPARDDSPGERARVGRDYLGAMVKRYDGNLAQAWAAYNAGPGAVDKALGEAQKDALSGAFRGGAPGPDYWLTKMPAETQAYVAKNFAAYQAGEGRPQAATLQDVHTAVRARVGEANPHRLKLALDESTRQFEDIHKAVKQREDEGTAEAQRWLAANGGRYSMMPASLRANVPPDQVDNLMNYGERVGRGDDRTNPAVYQQLSNPDFLKSLTENQFYSLSMAELSQADRKHFAGKRAELLNGAAGDKPGDLNTEAIDRVLTHRLGQLGIQKPGQGASTDAMERYGAIQGEVNRSVANAQAAAGKKFTDVEVQKHIDSLFAQTDVVKGFFGDSSVHTLTMQVDDIPGAVKDRLIADFKAAGISAPTKGEILGAYFMAKGAGKVKRITPLTAAK